jgi:hypothetical protein
VTLCITDLCIITGGCELVVKRMQPFCIEHLRAKCLVYTLILTIRWLILTNIKNCPSLISEKRTMSVLPLPANGFGLTNRSIPEKGNMGMKAVLGGFESRLEGEAELVAADEDGSAPEPLQELQHEEVVVGLHGVPHNGTETLECVAVGSEVAEDLRLAVEVERAPHSRRHGVLNPDSLAVQVPSALAAAPPRPPAAAAGMGR